MSIAQGKGIERPRGPRRLLNECWPTYPRAVRAAPDPIQVEVRLEWEDREEWCAGRAIRWTRTVVCVAVWHPRVSPVQAVWVRAVDVRRI